MLRTNSKEYLTRLDEYIGDCIDIEDNEEAILKEKVDYFMSEFDRVANYEYNLKRFPNTIDRIDDYMQGLPFNFAFSYADILEDVAKLHGVEAIPTDKEDVIIKGYNKHIANRITKLSEGK